jgi:nicotinamide-nucleotide adenylyltransferase
MIKNALLEYGIPSHRFYIIPVPDISINSIWAYYIKSFVPSFQKVLGRNSLVIRLFREAGIETENPPEFDRINYNSTYIRKLIIKSDNRWRSLVPKSVSKFIEEINGEERLREIVGIKVKKL